MEREQTVTFTKNEDGTVTVVTTTVITQTVQEAVLKANLQKKLTSETTKSQAALAKIQADLAALE